MPTKLKRNTALIIPGYGMSPSRREYKKIAQFFAAQNIKPKVINIKWDRKVPRSFSGYVNDFLRQAKPYKNDSLYVLGFSFGAMTALLAHKLLKYKSLILCSLSPYFEQDRNRLKPQWVKWWDKTYNDIFDFDRTARGLKAKTYILVGGSESKSCLIRAKDANKKIPSSTIKIVRSAEHKLQHPQYLKEIERIIKQF